MTPDHLAAEGRARELLAAAYEAEGDDSVAQSLRSGKMNILPAPRRAIVDLLARLDRMTEALVKARDRFRQIQREGSTSRPHGLSQIGCEAGDELDRVLSSQVVTDDRTSVDDSAP